MDSVEPSCYWPLITDVHMCLSGPDRSKELTLAVFVVYHHTGGTCIDSEGCVSTFGSHVVGERVCIGATGLNWSVLNLSSEGSAHGCCVGSVVANDLVGLARNLARPLNLVISCTASDILAESSTLVFDECVGVNGWFVTRDCICT